MEVSSSKSQGDKLACTRNKEHVIEAKITIGLRVVQTPEVGVDCRGRRIRAMLYFILSQYVL